MSTHIPWADISIGMNDDNIFHSHSQFFGDDLSDYGIRSLSHICCACDDINRSKVIDLNDRSASVGFIDPGTSSHMAHGGHSYSSSISSAAMLSPVQLLGNGIDAFF